MKDTIQTELRDRLQDPDLQVEVTDISDFIDVKVIPTDQSLTNTVTVHRTSEQSDAKLSKIVIDLAYKYILQHKVDNHGNANRPSGPSSQEL